MFLYNTSIITNPKLVWLQLQKTDYKDNDSVKKNIANLLQDVMEITTQDIMRNGQG